MKYAAATLAALLLLAVLAAAWLHHRLGVAEQQRDQAQTQMVAAQFGESDAKADVRTVVQFHDRVQVIEKAITVTQREIPRYVTPATDALYPLPVGFVRVHDAAATLVPGVAPAGAADAQASPVKASDALAIITDNYGICHETAAQLIELQDRLLQRYDMMRNGAEATGRTTNGPNP